MDPRLSPLLCQPLSWYQALSRVLMAKYGDHCRVFMGPDGNIQHIVVLHPRYVEAFMMLSIDLHSSRGVSFFLQCMTPSFNQIAFFLHACCHMVR
jgi:hypothetical protein